MENTCVEVTLTNNHNRNHNHHNHHCLALCSKCSPFLCYSEKSVRELGARHGWCTRRRLAAHCVLGIAASGNRSLWRWRRHATTPPGCATNVEEEEFGGSAAECAPRASALLQKSLCSSWSRSLLLRRRTESRVPPVLLPRAV